MWPAWGARDAHNVQNCTLCLPRLDCCRIHPPVCAVPGDSNSADEAKMMEAQMSGGMGAGQPGQAPDMGKIFKQHGDNLDMVTHKEIVPDAEARLIKRSPREAAE